MKKITKLSALLLIAFTSCIMLSCTKEPLPEPSTTDIVVADNTVYTENDILTLNTLEGEWEGVKEDILRYLNCGITDTLRVHLLIDPQCVSSLLYIDFNSYSNCTIRLVHNDYQGTFALNNSHVQFNCGSPSYIKDGIDYEIKQLDEDNLVLSYTETENEQWFTIVKQTTNIYFRRKR